MTAGARAGADLPAGACADAPVAGAVPANPGAADRCPRCGSAFHCGMAGPAPCACRTVRLAADTLAGLRQRYSGCLCLRCLTGLAGSVPTAPAPPPPAASAPPARG